MFQKFSWSGQLLAGLILFGVSFWLEGLVLTAYLGTPWLGFAVAGGLEASKVLAIVLYRILREQTQVAYPVGVRRVAIAFRGALLVLSTACSVMFLAQQLDRPAMEAVRAADRAQADDEYWQALSLVQETHRRRGETLQAELSAQERRQREDLGRRYLPAITALEAKLDAEMNNVVGGEFKGKRYRELEARLKSEKEAYAWALARADSSRSLERTALAELEESHDAQLRRLAEEREARAAVIRSANYVDDDRVEHPTARAFVSVLAAVFAWQPSTPQFVFFFSLFLSLTMELGIVVAFEHITLARLPVFMAEHRSDLHRRRKQVEVDSELRSFEMDDELTRVKVRRKRESIEDALRGAPSDKLAETTEAVRTAF